jgi:hypothetical protein
VADRFEDMLASLKKAAAALRAAEIPFAVAGGFAVWAQGGFGSEHDVALLVKEADAERALGVLEAEGMRGERPPEGWLVKAYDGDVLIDLIWHPAGLEVTDELLARCPPTTIEAMPVPVLPPADVLVTKLLSLSEHNADFASVLQITRVVREQVDWAGVAERTAESPFGRAFFVLAAGLGLVPGEAADHAEGALGH